LTNALSSSAKLFRLKTKADVKNETRKIRENKDCIKKSQI